MGEEAFKVNETEIEEVLALIGDMPIFHHEAIADAEYMRECYARSDRIRNSGMTLVARPYFKFGLALMFSEDSFNELEIGTTEDTLTRVVKLGYWKLSNDDVFLYMKKIVLAMSRWSCCHSKPTRTSQ